MYFSGELVEKPVGLISDFLELRSEVFEAYRILGSRGRFKIGGEQDFFVVLTDNACKNALRLTPNADRCFALESDGKCRNEVRSHDVHLPNLKIFLPIPCSLLFIYLRKLE